MKKMLFYTFDNKTNVNFNFVRNINLLFKKACELEGITKTNVYQHVIKDDIIYDIMVEIVYDSQENYEALEKSSVLQEFHLKYDSIIEESDFKDFK